MRTILLGCAAALAAASLAQAQLQKHWVRYHDGPNSSDDYGGCSAVDASGNLYFSGETVNLLGELEILTGKYDSSGNKLWTRTYSGGGGGPDYAWALELDLFGNVIVAGDSVGIGTSSDLVTLKYDPQGNLVWANRYNGPGNDFDTMGGGLSLAVDSAGNVISGGYVWGAGTSFDAYVVKYSPAGTVLWEKLINGPANGGDDCYGIDLDPADNVYVAGSITNIGSGYDIMVLKYDPAGALQWMREYDGPASASDYSYQVAVDSYGNAAVAGLSVGVGTAEDCVTLVYDTNGVLLFEERYDGPTNRNDLPFSVAIHDSGLVAVTGRSEDRYGTSAATLLYDLAGNLLWGKRYQVDPFQIGEDRGTYVLFDVNGNVFVQGSGWSGPESGHDGFLQLFSPSGTLLFEAIQDGKLHGDDIPYYMAQDGNGVIYVSGYSQRGDRHLDVFLTKYGPPTKTLPAPNLPEDAEDPIQPLLRAPPRLPGALERLPPRLGR